MRNEYLSEFEARQLTFREFVLAARKTLEELYERKSHLASNPPASDVLHLTLADRRLLRGMHIAVEEKQKTGSADSDATS